MKDILTLDQKPIADAVWAAVKRNTFASRAVLAPVPGFDDRWCIYLPDDAPQTEQDAVYYYALGVFDGSRAWTLKG